MIKNAGRGRPIWQKHQVEALLLLMKENFPRLIGNSLSKTKVYSEITATLQEVFQGVTRKQVEKKWRSMKYGYRTYQRTKLRGARALLPKHFNLLRSILGDTLPAKTQCIQCSLLTSPALGPPCICRRYPGLALVSLLLAQEILNKAKSGCSSKRILWKKADGTTSNTPQIHVGACTLECHQGEDRYLKIKARRLEKKEQEKDNEHGYSSKNTRRFLKQPSKKQNCPAQINIKQVLLFPEFQVDDAKSEFKRKKKSKELKEALGSDSRLKVKVQFHVTLPDPVSGHEGHPVGNDAVACLRKTFDKQVGEKIRQLKAGVSKVPDLQRHLSLSADTVAKDEKLDVNILDQRFFPTEADLKN
ncbi:hypothetical protein C7M84_008022, partial [Penaeus vannamei]